jgi:hypothetical protein
VVVGEDVAEPLLLRLAEPDGLVVVILGLENWRPGTVRGDEGRLEAAVGDEPMALQQQPHRRSVTLTRMGWCSWPLSPSMASVPSAQPGRGPWKRWTRRSSRLALVFRRRRRQLLAPWSSMATWTGRVPSR